MSNLELLRQEYISFLESDYSPTKNDSQFIVCEKKDYNSIVLSDVCYRSDHIQQRLMISICLRINGYWRHLYKSERYESNSFKNARDSLRIPIGMVKRAEDILNCLIVFEILTGEVRGLTCSKKRVYSTSSSFEINDRNISHSLEIRLDNNTVTLDKETKTTIELFSSILSHFSPIDYVEKRIKKDKANSKLQSIIRLEKQKQLHK